MTRRLSAFAAAFLLAACGRVGVDLLPMSSPLTPDDAGSPIDSDASSCETNCKNAHGTAECVAERCVTTCSNGYADCDGVAANGCEADVMTAVRSCGSCSLSCANPHGSAACSDGLCTPSCATGFADCDGNTSNGCEAALTAPETCGSCQLSCSNEHGTTACSEGACRPTCDAGYADCDGATTNGCEANIGSDPLRCGSCTNRCETGQICVAGECQASPCPEGRGECDGESALACETALDSVSHCGACGRVCPDNGGTPVCNAGVCGTSCNLNGTFAVKIDTPVTWPGTTRIRAGSGSYTFWLRLQGTQSGNSIATTVSDCGRIVPDVNLVLVPETVKYGYPSTLFDETPPFMLQASATATLTGTSPGSRYTLPLSALVMGISLSDPIHDSWPAEASGVTSIDSDLDGKPGVTGLYRSDGGYSFPPLRTSAFAPRARQPYAASRLVFSLDGTLNSCTRSTGPATVRAIDTRILGCSVADESRDCSGLESAFLDTKLLDLSIATATYTMVKIADGAACSAVRSALP